MIVGNAVWHPRRDRKLERAGLNDMAEHHGRLVLAATPLGDSRDASPRLAEALTTADVVAAEDTRKTRALASALDATLTGRVVSFYDAVETSRLGGLVAAIEQGQTVLLVTDAGMPSVSDPGYRLVAACVEKDLPVTCLPGPSAVTTALALSGLPCERFCFEGFAPRKDGERRRFFAALADEPRTAVFFESPHRIAATLALAAEVLGADRRAAVCRELTKTYEEVRRGPLGELASWAADGVRWEITVVLAGAEPRQARNVDELVEEVRRLASEGMRLKDAAAAVAETSGVSKKTLYDLAVRV
jgi:16S rRNA (cytidine1402-2'-O)-methyltransferase